MKSEEQIFQEIDDRIRAEINAFFEKRRQERIEALYERGPIARKYAAMKAEGLFKADATEEDMAKFVYHPPTIVEDSLFCQWCPPSDVSNNKRRFICRKCSDDPKIA